MAASGSVVLNESCAPRTKILASAFRKTLTDGTSRYAGGTPVAGKISCAVGFLWGTGPRRGARRRQALQPVAVNVLSFLHGRLQGLRNQTHVLWALQIQEEGRHSTRCLLLPPRPSNGTHRAHDPAVSLPLPDPCFPPPTAAIQIDRYVRLRHRRSEARCRHAGARPPNPAPHSSSLTSSRSRLRGPRSPVFAVDRKSSSSSSRPSRPTHACRAASTK